MTQDIRLVKLAENVGCIAGENVKDEVMKGSDAITSKTSQGKKAKWVKGAMERLNSLVDQETGNEIMGNCSCETEGKIKKAKSLYSNSIDIDDFLSKLSKARIVGTRLAREGDIIYVFYDRCYCGLVKATKEKIPVTYCQCSRGYTQKVFEGIFERSLRVDLLQSIINGDKECKFAVYLEGD